MINLSEIHCISPLDRAFGTGNTAVVDS